jgi:hypothetical protein
MAGAGSAHTNAETGGISNLPGLAPPRNATTWHRAGARVALANGDLTASQFVSVMNAIAGWEQAQINVARDTLKNSGDYAPA